MNEAEIKDQLTALIRDDMRTAVTIRHEDENTAGIPDISVTYNKRTVWLEVKYANPDLRGRGLQKLTCLRLSLQGYCWFIVYKEVKGRRSTWIVDPVHVVNETINLTPDERMAPGFDHEFVIQFIRRECGDYH